MIILTKKVIVGVEMTVAWGGGMGWDCLIISSSTLIEIQQNSCITHYMDSDNVQVKSYLPNCFIVEIGHDTFNLYSSYIC